MQVSLPKMIYETQLHSARRKPVYELTLALLAFVTWVGVARMSFNGDDYQYLHSLAPINNWLDLFKPFWSHDPNPSVFRPIANMTMVSDFLIYGWHGWGFHLTNLLLHVVATLIAFRFFERVFVVGKPAAFGMAALFAVLGSHDFNILTSTARADILVAIFTMVVLLLEHTIVAEKNADVARRRGGLVIASLIALVLALLSKEVAIVIPVLIVLFFWFGPEHRTFEDLRRGLKHVIPHLLIVAAFYFYHSHFTTTTLQSQPLTSDATRSVIAPLRNVLYGMGYMFAPLDLETATILLTKYRLPMMLIGGSFVVLAMLLAFRVIGKRSLVWFYRPVMLGIISGSLVLLSFERWRLYTPSIAGVAIVVGFLAMLQAKYPKPRVEGAIKLVALIYLGLNIGHAFAMSSNWAESTRKITEYKSAIGEILAPIASQRSDTVGVTFLDVPAKLGSASVLQLGLEDIAKQGIAERLYPKDAAVANVTRVKLNANSSSEIYAFDRTVGFNEFTMSRIGSRNFELSTAPNSPTKIIPSLGFVRGVARRDWKLTIGDTAQLPTSRVIIQSAQGPVASQLRIELTDTSTIPILFEHGRFSAIR